MMKKFFFPEKVFYSIRKSQRTGRGPGKKNRKNSKKFGLYELPARPDRTGTGPVAGPAPREEGAGATDEREVAPAAWGGGEGGPAGIGYPR